MGGVKRSGYAQMSYEEWVGFGRRVEAHLAVIEGEMAALRKTLRAAGVEVRVQRIRITGSNGRANEVLGILRNHGGEMSPSTIAGLLRVSPEYAFDLLAALVANNQAEKVSRGRYKALA